MCQLCDEGFRPLPLVAEAVYREFFVAAMALQAVELIGPAGPDSPQLPEAKARLAQCQENIDILWTSVFENGPCTIWLEPPIGVDVPLPLSEPWEDGQEGGSDV